MLAIMAHIHGCPKCLFYSEDTKEGAMAMVELRIARSKAKWQG